MTDHTNIPRDIDLLVGKFPEPLRLALADLHGAPQHVAETTIGLLPFGRRALLEAVNVTQTVSVEDADGSAVRQRITLTDWGRQVIDACADYEPEPEALDEGEQEQRSTELRSRLSAAPPATQ
jgi:hypothetical protein